MKTFHKLFESGDCTSSTNWLRLINHKLAKKQCSLGFQLLQNTNRKSNHWSAWPYETATEQSPASLQKHSLVGCTIHMPTRRTALGGSWHFCWICGPLKHRYTIDQKLLFTLKQNIVWKIIMCDGSQRLAHITIDVYMTYVTRLTKSSIRNKQQQTYLWASLETATQVSAVYKCAQFIESNHSPFVAAIYIPSPLINSCSCAVTSLYITSQIFVFSLVLFVHRE